MPSNIDYTTIDPTFPVSGKNNNSQGFRDNFAAIKSALSVASTEVNDLQVSTAKLNDVNDFSFIGSLSSVKLKNSGLESIVDPSGSSFLDFSQASYFQTVVSQSTTFNVVNWPSYDLAKDGFFQVRLEVRPTESFPLEINIAGINGGVVKPESNTVLPYVATDEKILVWDLWTADNGTTVFVKFVGKF